MTEKNPPRADFSYTKNAHTYRQYIFIWIGQIFSLCGSSIVQFSFSWYLTSQSEDPTIMSIFLLISFVPHILLGPIAGVVADKYSRKAVILLADGFQATITLILIILTQFVPLSLALLIGAVGIRFIGQCFHYPASNAVMATMVPDDKLSQLNGIIGLVNALVQIGSPFIGAILIAKYNLIQIFWIDVITFIFAATPLIFIKIPNVTHSPADVSSKLPTSDQSQKQMRQKVSFFKEMKEGLHAVRTTPGLMVLISTAIFNNLLITPLNVLSSYFVLYDHGGNAQIYAIVGIFIQAGMIGGSILMSIKKKWRHRRRTFTVWHYIAFTGYVILALAPRGWFWMICLGGFIFLFGIPIINTLYISYMQIAVRKEMQGRVFAFDRMLSSIASPLGMILSAPLALLLGIGNLFLVCALIAMGIITIFVATKQIHKIDFEKYDPTDASDASDPTNMKDGEKFDAEDSISDRKIGEVEYPEEEIPLERADIAT